MSSVFNRESEASCRDFIRGKRVVFWDFDGVIKESIEVKTVGFMRLFEPYGAGVVERVKQHHEAHGGMSRYEKVPLYLEWAGQLATADRVQVFCDHFSRLVRQAVIDAPWVPGVREYLLENHSQQQFVLVSATPQKEMQQILDSLGLAKCFGEVHGAPTAKTTAIREALGRLECLAADALVVGDSDTDFRAAEANMVPFLLRRTAYNQPLQDRHHGPAFDAL